MSSRPHRPPPADRDQRRSRSPTTGCWPTATRPHSWPATGRSTGCACRGTTRARSSRAILDPDAGHWLIRPAGEYESERRYLPGSLVVETTFTTHSGSVRLVRRDGGRARPTRSRPRASTRRMSCCAASRASAVRVELVTEIAVRPEFGLVRPLVRLDDGGARTFGADPWRSASGVPLEVRGEHDARDVHRRRRRARRLRRCAGAPARRVSARRRRPATSRTASPTPSRRGARGRPSTTSTTARTASSSVIRRVCSRGSPTARPARSWPPPRPRCRRPSAASATGTTASRGSATRA